MTTRRLTVQLGRDAIALLVDDEDASIAGIKIADGATVPRGDLAQTLESLAAYLRTGELGPLPPGARVVGAKTQAPTARLAGTKE